MSKNSEAVIITGASRRIGLAIARKCIDIGFKVILHYRKMYHDLEMILSTEENFKNNIFLVQQELKNHPETLIETSQSFPVKVIGLINNASIFTQGDLSDGDHLEKILTINTLVPMRLTAAFHQKIKAGWVINLTDALCQKPNIKFENYRLSKHFLELITKQQALLFAPDVRVNGLAPGAMIPSPSELDYFSKLASSIPLQKTGDVSSLLKALVFLIETPYITGEIIRIDGGWSLQS